MASDMIHEFLKARPVAVVGASNNRSKYGNIILRDLRGRGWRDVYAVHPAQAVIEGEPGYPSLAECPRRPELAVLVVPSAVGVRVVEQAAELGVGRIWLQPGADSPEVIERARQLGLRTVQACIMVQAERMGA